MDRKSFIKQCGFACLGSLSVPLLLQGCITPKTLTANIAGNDLVIPASDFEIKGKATGTYRSYLVLHNDALKFPVCVFRHSQNQYTAVWMSCTHQGAELQVFGDKLQCPAHGSEFDNKGEVQGGPAARALRTFPVRVEDNYLKISLKKNV